MREAIRSDETGFALEQSFEPHPKIGPRWGDTAILAAANAVRPNRERRTRTRIFAELHGLGRDGGGDAVRGCAADWRRACALIEGAATRLRSDMSGSATAR
ncbi:hypothetical protein [Albimonas pacifica]|uniref:hypothetical protein n=1 Tax=Albimonas pacifica TaxID=1114924 RepID=UPI0011605E9E|nr:hypothetical protein [Albimonas pacifica]